MLAQPPALHGLAEKMSFFQSSKSLSSNCSSPSENSSLSISSIIDQQTQAAAANKNRAQQLSQLIQTTLKAHRETAIQALCRAKDVEQKWVAVESQMYKSLQPFTTEAFKSRMSRAVGEAEQLSESLADSFLDTLQRNSNVNTVNYKDLQLDHNKHDNDIIEDISIDDVNVFIKNYRNERKTYHMRKEVMERWKDDRVSRTY